MSQVKDEVIVNGHTFKYEGNKPIQEFTVEDHTLVRRQSTISYEYKKSYDNEVASAASNLILLSQNSKRELVESISNGPPISCEAGETATLQP